MWILSSNKFLNTHTRLYLSKLNQRPQRLTHMSNQRLHHQNLRPSVVAALLVVGINRKSSTKFLNNRLYLTNLNLNLNLHPRRHVHRESRAPHPRHKRHHPFPFRKPQFHRHRYRLRRVCSRFSAWSKLNVNSAEVSCIDHGLSK